VNKGYKPLVVLFGFQSLANTLTFLGRAGRIEISDHIPELLSILQHCNGIESIEEIHKKVPDISDELFTALISFCKKYGILQDSRRLFFNFHEDSSISTYFVSDISPEEIRKLEARPQLKINETKRLPLPKMNSPLLRLIEQRKTSRVFTDHFISTEVISGLLESMYHIAMGRSVPSAGALYSLSIYVVIESEELQLPKGCYLYDSASHELLKVKEEIIDDFLFRIFDSELIVQNCSLIIFVAANLEHPAKKYANRAYRFILDEVGHVAQNAYLYCAEQGLGIVEYGGFNDKIAADQLGLKYPKHAVMTSLIVGTHDPRSAVTINEPFKDLAFYLNQQLVGDGRPIEAVWLREFKLNKVHIPRIYAMAKYRPVSSSVPKRAAKHFVASASAPTSSEVIVKVIAEAYERYVSGRYRIDKIFKAKDQKGNWLDPRVITPLTEKQLLLFPDLGSFSPEKEWQWVIGRRYLTGDKVYIPIDNVFYPLYPKEIGRKICYSANSSGVAAHTDRTQAILNALLELIERDAIMVTWYTKRRVAAIPIKHAPPSVKERAKLLYKNGYKVKLINITLDP
jgi:SagB-type dehydrogenase family enzyme